MTGLSARSEKLLKRDLQRLLVLQALHYSNVYTHFHMLFLRANEFTVSQAQAVMSVSLLCLGLPQLHTGYLADRYSRRVVIMIGSLLTVVGMIMYATTTHYGTWAFAGAIIAGLGWSCGNGADIALANDICRSLAGASWADVRRRYERAAYAFRAGGGALGCLVGTVLSINFGLRSTIWVQAAVYAAGPILVYFVHEDMRGRDVNKRKLRPTLVGILQNSSLMASMILSAAIANITIAFMKLAPMYYLPVQTDGNNPKNVAIWGFIWSGVLAWGMLPRAIGGRFLGREEWQVPVLGVLALGICGHVMLAISAPAVGWIALLGLAGALLLRSIGFMCLPQIDTRVSKLAGVDAQATAASFKLLIQLVMSAVVGLVSGWVVDRYGLAAGFWFTGLFVGAIAAGALVAARRLP